MSAPPPAKQWWCINGADVMAALQRAHHGDDPSVIYLELIANSESEAPMPDCPHDGAASTLRGPTGETAFGDLSQRLDASHLLHARRLDAVEESTGWLWRVAVAQAALALLIVGTLVLLGGDQVTAPTPETHPALAGLMELAEAFEKAGVRYRADSGFGSLAMGSTYGNCANQLRAAIAEASALLGEVEVREEWATQQTSGPIHLWPEETAARANASYTGRRVVRREVYRTPWRPADDQGAGGAR